MTCQEEYYFKSNIVKVKVVVEAVMLNSKKKIKN